MVVYDDASADARLVIYDKGVTKKARAPGTSNDNGNSMGQYEDFGEFQLLLRAGDVLIPKVDFVEPLKRECQHFVECVRTGQRPLTDGYDGLKVVKVLEAAQLSLGTEWPPHPGHGARMSRPRVSLLVAMRNEAGYIEPCLDFCLLRTIHPVALRSG